MVSPRNGPAVGPAAERTERGCLSDSERTGCAVASAENADRACPARIRVSWIQDQARTTAASVAPGQDPQRCPAGGVICVSPGEIDPTLHGSGARAYHAARAAQDQGAD